MFRRNPGRFVHKIALLRPSAPTRDELGGLAATTYTEELSTLAMMSQRSQSRRQVIGDYVTTETKYFVVRDLRTMLEGLDTSWRLSYDGTVYLINQIEVLDESRPYYLQLTATAINAGGGAR